MMRHQRKLRSARFVVAMTALLLAAYGLALPGHVRAGDDEDRYVVVKTAKTLTISGEEVGDALIVCNYDQSFAVLNV